MVMAAVHVERMTAEQWWAVLLEGSVGAILGLVGVFAALLWTFKHERASAAAEQTSDRLVPVLRQLVGQPPRGAPVEAVNEWVAAARLELLVFGTLELGKHQPVSEWAVDAGNKLPGVWAIERSARTWVGGEQIGDAANQTFKYAVWIAAGLTQWHRGHLTDDGLHAERFGDEPSAGAPS